MDSSSRETWNARYGERGNDPGPPSDWLVENQALIGGTRAMDLVCGTGRAVLVAERPAALVVERPAVLAPQRPG